MTEFTNSITVNVLGKIEAISSLSRERTSLEDDYEFDVVSGRLRDTDTRDYAISAIRANGTTPMQRVERTQPIIDIPIIGKGICIQFRPSTQQTTILEFDQDHPIENQHIQHQQGDYVIWIAGDATLGIYDICDEKVFEPKDVTDLDPKDNSIPPSFLDTVKQYIHPQSHLAKLLDS